jgi:NAD(P)-dependent dehydrogenase (short-subunit alcohol dehydrogenase family)
MPEPPQPAEPTEPVKPAEPAERATRATRAERATRVCVVVGVGPGTGAAIARRFAAAEHTIALLARTTETSEGLARELPDARAYACDATDAASVATTIAAIERDQGPIAVVAYNAGSGTWGTVETITPAALEAAFRINTLGLLHVAQAVIPPGRA